MGPSVVFSVTSLAKVVSIVSALPSPSSPVSVETDVTTSTDGSSVLLSVSSQISSHSTDS